MAQEAGQPSEPNSAAQPTWTMERVYETFIDSVYRFIYRRVGNREDAEDLTAQVFFKALHSLEHQREEASIRAWLYQVARTVIADHWRLFYRLPAVSLEFLPRLRQPTPVPHEISPFAAEEATRLLSLLPENYRRVLSLRFIDHLTIRETAAEMGTTEGNVKILQFRALRRAADIAKGAPP
jgi:RNA polymerase sigma-70 factor (ECF subfamily)